MTGTSMDGIDISLVQTNGTSLKRLNENYFHKYSDDKKKFLLSILDEDITCLLYTSPSPRDAHESRMPSSA